VTEPLIDRIHESAFAPELWPGILDELAQIAEARGGALCAFNAAALHWTTSASICELWTSYTAEGWAMRGQRRARLFGARYPGFLGEHDLYTAEELDLDPIYRDFLRSRGYGWSAATAIRMPTGDRIVLRLERDYARGPVEPAVLQQLDLLRPHLARSAMVSARMRLERARIASETLALIGLPALVLNDQGVVLAANQLIAALDGFIRWRTMDRVSLKDSSADALFRQAVATLNLESAATVRSFAVRAADALMVAHVIPICGAARDVFARCAAVLVMTPVTIPRTPRVELLQSLFDLSPAEARVARALAAGETVETIAAAGAVSRNTVRSQLRAVMEKTGCGRQAEVVALLSGITAPCG
jgi:DNA-binding CsgD family transcriptional regulator